MIISVSILLIFVICLFIFISRQFPSYFQHEKVYFTFHLPIFLPKYRLAFPKPVFMKFRMGANWESFKRNTRGHSLPECITTRCYEVNITVWLPHESFISSDFLISDVIAKYSHRSFSILYLITFPRWLPCQGFHSSKPFLHHQQYH